jgi:hypothetical protein
MDREANHDPLVDQIDSRDTGKIPVPGYDQVTML